MHGRREKGGVVQRSATKNQICWVNQPGIAAHFPGFDEGFLSLIVPTQIEVPRHCERMSPVGDSEHSKLDMVLD